MWAQYGSNRMLLALSQLDADLLKWAQPVELIPGRILQRAGASVDKLYFPGTALLSEQHLLADGHISEVAIVGFEGMTGLACCLGQTSAAPTQMKVIVGGSGYQLDIARIPVLGTAAHAMLPLLLANAYHNQQQLIFRHSCLQRHNALHRLSCWLFTAMTRLPVERIRITQSELAICVGLRRESITQVLGRLRELRVLRTGRANLTIDDHAQLHEHSCDCVDSLASALDRHLGAISALAQGNDSFPHPLRGDARTAMPPHQPYLVVSH